MRHGEVLFWLCLFGVLNASDVWRSTFFYKCVDFVTISVTRVFILWILRLNVFLQNLRLNTALLFPPALYSSLISPSQISSHLLVLWLKVWAITAWLCFSLRLISLSGSSFWLLTGLSQHTGLVTDSRPKGWSWFGQTWFLKLNKVCWHTNVF